MMMYKFINFLKYAHRGYLYMITYLVPSLNSYFTQNTNECFKPTVVGKISSSVSKRVFRKQLFNNSIILCS